MAGVAVETGFDVVPLEGVDSLGEVGGAEEEGSDAHEVVVGA